MGIETIIALGVTAAVAGASAQRAHGAEVHAEHVAKETAQDTAEQQAQAADTQKKSQLDLAGEAQRARQRALAASYASGNRQMGVATNGTGSVGAAPTVSKTLLGLSLLICLTLQFVI